MSLIKTDFSPFNDRKDIDLWAEYLPANIISGDLYDFFFIDNDNLIFTIGDVSGKGIPAAIFMSISQTIIKSNFSNRLAKTIVNKANKELYTNNQHQFFLTLFLGILNTKTGRFNYCNAAHSCAFVLKATGELIELVKSHGMPLGLYPEKNYTDSETELKTGDSVILVTDGIIDQVNHDNQHFGMERLKEIITTAHGLKSKPTIDLILEKMSEFKNESLQSDDITIMVIKYTGKK